MARFFQRRRRIFKRYSVNTQRTEERRLNKSAFASFVESTLRLDTETMTKREISRAFASCLLLTSYIVGSSAQASNHWAQFEAWTMVCSYILGLATRESLEDQYWRASYDLALLSAQRALANLVKECEEREEFVEGHPLADGYFFGARQTLLTGLVAAWGLNQRRAGNPSLFPIEFFKRSIRQSFFWGESAVPSFALAALELEMTCQPREAENLMFQVLQISGVANDRGNRGVPDIFTSIEDSLIFQHRLRGHENEN